MWGREGGWSEGAELSQRRGSGQSLSQVEPDDCGANGPCRYQSADMARQSTVSFAHYFPSITLNIIIVIED